MNSVKRFTRSLVIFSTLIASIMLAIPSVNQNIQIESITWIALIYYVLLSYITFRITHSAVAKDNKTFITRTYSAIGIRFIFTLFPLIIYLLFSPERSIIFVIVYLLLYLLFTSFEIYFLVVNLRPDFNKKSPDAAQ